MVICIVKYGYNDYDYKELMFIEKYLWFLVEIFYVLMF